MSRRSAIWSLGIALVLVAGGLAQAAAPEVAWTRQFGTAETDYGNGVGASSNGLVAVTGRTDGSLGGPNAGFSDSFVRRLAPSGATVWTRQIGSPDTDLTHGVAATNSGVNVVGHTLGAFFDQPHVGDYDAFIVRYEPDGDVDWARIFGTSVNEIAWGVAASGAQIYITGRTDGNMHGTSAGSGDGFLRRYDDQGNAVWTRQFGTSASDEAYGVAVTSTGIYVTGYTGGDLAGPNLGTNDAFLRKYDAAGNVKWTRQFGTTSFDVPSAVAAVGNEIYVGGRTDGTFPGATAAGSGDAWIRKYDAAGNVVWTRQFGSTLPDYVKGVAATAERVHVAGNTNGTLPGQTPPGAPDAFLASFDDSGKPLSTRQFGTASGETVGGVAVAPSGVYVVGDTGGTFPGQTASGGADVFVTRFVSFQPDGLISTSRSRRFAGNDIYNKTGLKQKRSARAGPGVSRTFYIRGQNDGDATDSLKVKGCRSGSGFSVKYRSGARGGKNITSAVAGGRYRLRDVAPGAFKVFRAIITPTTAAPGSTRTCAVTLSSVARSTRKDTVKASVRRT